MPLSRLKTNLQLALKNFLRTLWYHPAHSKCTSNVALYVAEKSQSYEVLIKRDHFKSIKTSVFCFLRVQICVSKRQKKVSFWGSFLTSDLSKRFSTHTVLSSKVCKMFSKHSSFWWNKKHGHTTHRGEDIQEKLKWGHKKRFFPAQHCSDRS